MPTKHHLLVVDDEESLLLTYKSILKDTYQLTLVTRGNEALKKLKEENFSLVISDLMMPEMNGIELLENIKAVDGKMDVIMITATQDVRSAVKAVKLGAYDYITKPFEADDLLATIEKAIERKSLLRENTYLRQAIQEKSSYANIIGKSPAMQKTFFLIDKFSAIDSTVLVTGESGTGKELAAHAIYHKSQRAKKPFIVVNCAAIPENLLEVELFGCEKGAFTGALEKKEGKFELADGGTIFLDEIGCLKSSLQSKLLRFLQDNVVERIGGGRPLQLSVRVIAATNLELQEAIKRGEFRGDLYYRLDVMRIHLPPLRERKEDLPALIEYCISKFKHEFNKTVGGFNEEDFSALLEYAWPGNVRELKNIIERAVVLSENNGNLSLHDVSLGSHPSPGLPTNLNEAVKEFEKNFIKAALAKFDGNQTKTAESLGIHRTTLIAKMEQFGLKQV